MLPNTFPKAKTAKQMTEQRQNLAVSFYKNSQEVQDPGNQVVRRTSNQPLASFNSYLREAQTEANLGITVFKQMYPYITPLRSLYPIRQREWAPSDVGTPVTLWLDAADVASLVLSGTNVTRWNDKSGNGYTISQANPSLQPTLSDGRLFFPSTSTTLSSGGAVNLTDTYTAYCVFESSNQAEASRPVYIGNGNRAFYIAAGNMAVQTNSAGRIQNFGPFTYQKVFIGITTNGTTFQYGVNGGDFANIGTSYFSGSSSIFISVGNYLFTGFISEIVVYNSFLSVSQRQEVEGYLAWKWGLVGNLPANHPYKNKKLDPIVSNYL
jgi:hypothetical protein